jgi:uncharacterized membrane protein
MANRQPRPIPRSVRIFLVAFWGILCAAIAAAPLLQARGHDAAASWLHGIFSAVCHQDSARSFAVLGNPCAVCQRCSGIYLGLFFASLFPWELRLVRSPLRARRLWVAGATAPMLLDVLLSWTGLWAGSALARTATGALFGAMLASFLGPALGEIAAQARRSRQRVGPQVLGDPS